MKQKKKLMKNTSGIHPLLDRVLVQPEEIEEETEGGIIIPGAVADLHQMAQATGVFVEAGPDAFVHSRVYVERVVNGELCLDEVRTERWDPEHTPRPGDRVLFAKYGGLTNVGIDGVEYRVLNDRDITAGVEEGVTYTGIQSRKALGEARVRS